MRVLHTRALIQTACIHHLSVQIVIQAAIREIMQVRHRATVIPVIKAITLEQQTIQTSVIPRTAQIAIQAIAGQEQASPIRALIQTAFIHH